MYQPPPEHRRGICRTRNMEFYSSWRKIERAEKHIREIQALIGEFTNADFHIVSIENDANTRQNFVRVELDTSAFDLGEIALAIGDVLHNLRSSLDHLWFQVVQFPTDWTRFPIYDSGEELINGYLRPALEKQQITTSIVDLMLGIKPYEGGNTFLWGLHHLNIMDKHKLLIPTLQLVMVENVCFEDDGGTRIGPSRLFM